MPRLKQVHFVQLAVALMGMALFQGTQAMPQPQHPEPKPRLIVLADMGNEPDEEQQMVHLLLYANEFDIEGLIAVTGKYLRKDPQPELFFKLIGGYALVVNNLHMHADGWPEPGALQAVVAAGQRSYGIADTGPGRSSPGSRLIEQALLRPDPRPLHLIVNAGSNTLAQALIDLQQQLDPEAFAQALARLRVFENGAQDNAGAWIVHRWPAIHWIRSNYQTYAYGGPSIDGGQDNRGRAIELGPHTWKPYAYSGIGQHQWALEHLKGNHGPLMALWPIRQFPRGGVSFLEGGGTIPFLRLLPNGLNHPEHPEWGGWGGRYATSRSPNVWSKHGDVRVDEATYGPFHMFDELSDTWTDPDSGTTYTDNLFAPVWRWRQAFFRDFAARADWCVAPFEEANHAPKLSVDGCTRTTPLFRLARAGESLQLDASASSDPDGDALEFHWWIYPEAGNWEGSHEELLSKPDQPVVTLRVPADFEDDHCLHVILEVRDTSNAHPLTSYRRILVCGRLPQDPIN